MNDGARSPSSGQFVEERPARFLLNTATLSIVDGASNSRVMVTLSLAKRDPSLCLLRP